MLSPMPTQLRIPPHVACEVVDGEAVLLNLDTGIYFSLNASGTLAWQALRQDGDPEQALLAFRAAFPTAPAHVVQDFSMWLTQLEANGLVVREG